MNKLLTIIAVIAAATITTGRARIGETMEEATQRYGQPTVLKNDRGWTIFYKGNFQVNVTFYQGKIDTVEYMKWSAKRVVEMSEVEANNLLNANYSGEWISRGRDEWTTSTATLLAIKNYQVIEEDYTKSYHRLIVMTIGAMQRWLDDVAAKETAAQSGF